MPCCAPQLVRVATHTLSLAPCPTQDSANLDSVFEHLIRGGQQPVSALGVLVPEAYRDQPAYDAHPEVTEMMEYYAGLQEAWDGPALLTFCDGKQLGAQLDRNVRRVPWRPARTLLAPSSPSQTGLLLCSASASDRQLCRLLLTRRPHTHPTHACSEQGLRPARILLTDDGLLAMMSETGVVEVDDAHVVWKGRLGPGVCLTMDLETGAISDNLEVKTGLAKKAPYGEWLRKHRTVVEPGPFGAEAGGELGVNTVEQMTAFGWSMEDLEMQVADMSNGGKETLFSLGNDSPLSVLSQNPSTLYDYFKQRFAQVTNPPIDPLREGVVMNLDMSLGQRYDISRAPAEDLAKQLRVKSPVLNAAVRHATPPHTRHPRTPRLRPASTDHPSRRGRPTCCLHRSPPPPPHPSP